MTYMIMFAGMTIEYITARDQKAAEKKAARMFTKGPYKTVVVNQDAPLAERQAALRLSAEAL
jgi:hypothetical protein